MRHSILVPGSDKTGTHSNGTSTTHLRSVCTKLYETACWRSYACGCVTSLVSREGMANKCGVIDLSIVIPAAESYCAEAAKTPLYAANLREEAKLLKYFQAYKQLDDIHFEPFVVESGGKLGERAQEIFKKIGNFITQATGQSGSSIAYFWKSTPCHSGGNHAL